MHRHAIFVWLAASAHLLLQVAMGINLAHKGGPGTERIEIRLSDILDNVRFNQPLAVLFEWRRWYLSEPFRAAFRIRAIRVSKHVTLGAHHL